MELSLKCSYSHYCPNCTITRSRETHASMKKWLAEQWCNLAMMMVVLWCRLCEFTFKEEDDDGAGRVGVQRREQEEEVGFKSLVSWVRGSGSVWWVVSFHKIENRFQWCYFRYCLCGLIRFLSKKLSTRISSIKFDNYFIVIFECLNRPIIFVCYR